MTASNLFHRTILVNSKHRLKQQKTRVSSWLRKGRDSLAEFTSFTLFYLIPLRKIIYKKDALSPKEEQNIRLKLQTIVKKQGQDESDEQARLFLKKYFPSASQDKKVSFMTVFMNSQTP